MKKLILVLLVISFSSFSQEKIIYRSDSDFLKLVDSLSKLDNYQGLLKVFKSVNPNDSISTSVKISDTYYRLQLKKYSEVIDICNKEIPKSKGADLISFFTNKAVAYQGMGVKDSVISVYTKAISLFPKNSNLYTRRGKAYQKNEDFSRAYEDLKTAFLINPFNVDVHLSIGNLFYSQNKLSQALMAYNYYLLISPDGNNSYSVLNYFNDKYASKPTNDFLNNEITTNDKLFKNIDLLIRNRIALNKKYDIKNKIDVAYIKQNHLLFSQLKDLELKDDFFNTYYLSVYKWMIKEDKFDDFVYTVSFSVKNKKLKKIVDAKEKNIAVFYSDFYNKLLSITQKRNEVFRGKKQEVFYEYEDLKLVNIGQKKTGKYYGSFDFYSKDGKLSAQGDFDSSEKKTGKWTWYDKGGNVSEIVFYKNGLANGDYKIYHNNGNIKTTATYKDNLLERKYSKYNIYGALIEEKHFEKGKLEGMYVSNYSVGNSVKEYKIPYANDEIVGDVIQFYENGQKKYEANYIKGKKDGVVYNYFLNGRIEKKYLCKEGLLSGNYQNFYNNGKIYEEGLYKSNLAEGIWNYYYVDGKPYKVNEYSKDKSDGLHKEYAHLGYLLEEFEYKKDKLYKATYFDSKGNTLYSEKKDGKELNFKGYSVLGKIQTEGLYDIKGGKQGVWKYYNRNGVLKSVEEYENNESIGEYLSYYVGGQLKSKTNYEKGKLNGYAVYYYSNGQISEQGYYLNDNKNKEWRSYYIDGTLKYTEYYHKGKLNGDRELYDHEGKLNNVFTYDYGKLIKEKYYSPKDKSLIKTTLLTKLGNKPVVVESKFFNGVLKNKLTYLNGVLHGDYSLYYPNGQVNITGKYFNGKLDKEWKWYNSKGNLEKVANYTLGYLNGDYKAYYDTGNLSTIKKYILGQLNGKSISYAKDGKTITDIIEYSYGTRNGETKFYSTEGHLQLVRYYDMGVLLGYAYLGKDNQLLEMIPIENESAKVIAYYDNGNKSREFEISNGDFVNDYIEYFYNGKIERKSFYFNDEENGVYTKYYKNGNIKETSNYILGELNGSYKQYYPSGALKTEYTYKNDEIVGVYKKYSEDGKIKEKGKCYGGEEFEER